MNCDFFPYPFHVLLVGRLAELLDNPPHLRPEVAVTVVVQQHSRGRPLMRRVRLEVAQRERTRATADQSRATRRKLRRLGSLASGRIATIVCSVNSCILPRITIRKPSE